MKEATFTAAYVAFYPMLAEMCRKHGYALTIHGTVVRDLDLVAIPWIDEAVDADVLLDAIMTYTKSIITLLTNTTSELLDKEDKPHGRVAYIIQLGNGACIDLSIMQKVTNV